MGCSMLVIAMMRSPTCFSVFNLMKEKKKKKKKKSRSLLMCASLMKYFGAAYTILPHRALIQLAGGWGSPRCPPLRRLQPVGETARDVLPPELDADDAHRRDEHDQGAGAGIPVLHGVSA